MPVSLYACDNPTFGWVLPIEGSFKRSQVFLGADCSDVHIKTSTSQWMIPRTSLTWLGLVQRNFMCGQFLGLCKTRPISGRSLPRASSSLDVAAWDSSVLILLSKYCYQMSATMIKQKFQQHLSICTLPQKIDQNHVCEDFLWGYSVFCLVCWHLPNCFCLVYWAI